MTAQGIAAATADHAEPDHAGGTVAALLLAHPDVASVRHLGADPCAEDDGGTWYGLEFTMRNGERIAVDARKL